MVRLRGRSVLWPALLGPASMAAAQPDPFEARVARALERSRPVLLEHLRLHHGGVHALLCLAAAHDGMSPREPVFASALERLSRSRLVGTYDLALRLMVMAEVADFPRRDELLERDVRRLLARRLRGGFTYPQGYEDWDLSNTQYAALGLRSAAALGARIDDRVWRELAEAVLAAQAEDGGWPYTVRARRHRPYASMTVAGIAVLRICADALQGEAPAGIDEAVDRGWDWMARHRAEIGSPDTLSCFYFHYGLERAAVLCDVVAVGGVDWYRAGAEMLLARQRDSGAWHSVMEIRPGALPGEGSPVDTAFAILFLRRAFSKTVVPVTGPRGLDALGDNADLEAVRRVGERLGARGLHAMPLVLAGLRSPVRTRRAAAVRALILLTGTEFGFHPDLDAAAAAGPIAAAERWWRERRGR